MAQGEEIVPSTMETHQGEQDKGKEHSEASLEAEKPQQRSFSYLSRCKPRALQSFKKRLNDKKVRERSLLESNPENAHRRLLQESSNFNSPTPTQLTCS